GASFLPVFGPNRTKSASGLFGLLRQNTAELAFQSEFGTESLRQAYRRIHSYVEREMLLAMAWKNALVGRGKKTEWRSAADFIERICIHGVLNSD
ncbi:hypothetical protein, partial [Sphingopyxis sp.]|uniref:hypothetical protein n=1 Tax=Sphingopyxis sp. TaxID=1908224 RepID=UPI0040354282